MGLLLACGNGNDLSLGQQNNKALGADSGVDHDAGRSNDSGTADGSGSDLPCYETPAAYCPEAGIACDFGQSLQACASGIGGTFGQCGAYDVINTHGLDNGSVSYFDHATGLLVAIIDWIAPDRVSCSVGPASGFAEPTCQGPYTPCASDGGAPPDAGGPLACKGTAASACTTSTSGTWPPSCYATWTAARAACSAQEDQQYGACGAYDAINDQGVDSSYRYFYDHVTGQLVAVVSDGLVLGQTCVGGPSSGFTPPGCAWTQCP
jgi:hypothetical protein